MDRSPGFGSAPCYENALLRLAFTMASFPQELNRATREQLVGSFFNRNAVTAFAAPTPCKHTISGTISSPSRAAFQLSITVLVHYRSEGVFSLATSSWLLPTRFLGPRRTLDRKHVRRDAISLTGLSPSLVPLSRGFSYRSRIERPALGGRTLSSSTWCSRQPKLITLARGQTCVQLGTKAQKTPFRLVRVRSPLLAESGRFHLPVQPWKIGR